MKKLYTFLSNILFYNFILRLILEGYMQYAITSLTNVRSLQWGNSSDTFASLFAIAILIILLVFPFLIWFLLWHNLAWLNTGKHISTYGSVYNELRITRFGVLYNVFYVLRRIMFAYVAVYCD